MNAWNRKEKEGERQTDEPRKKQKSGKTKWIQKIKICYVSKTVIFSYFIVFYNIYVNQNYVEPCIPRRETLSLNKKERII